jgi:hypothetical protein
MKTKRIIFDPYFVRHGEPIKFTSRFFTAKSAGRGPGWFVFGNESTGRFYSGNYSRLVAWPSGKTKREHYEKRGKMHGWETRREAAKAAVALTRAVRMGKFK